jgi:hypothetical protein
MRFLLFAALPLAAACSFHANDSDDGKPGVPGTGSGSTRTYSVSGFNGIELRGSDDVDVRVGGAFSVTATGDSDVLDRLKIEKDGDSLRIGRRRDDGFNWGKHGHATIHVTLPALSSVEVAGSGDVTVDKVTGNAFKGSMAGSGGLGVKDLATGSASISVAGSGDVTLAGKVGQFDVNVAGSGDIDAAGLTASQAKVSIMGSGNLKAAVNGPATVTVMGSGDVDLGPNATCKTTKMGSGSVTCGH